MSSVTEATARDVLTCPDTASAAGSSRATPTMTARACLSMIASFDGSQPGCLAARAAALTCACCQDRQRLGESHRRPGGRGGRDELIAAVWETSLEVLLESERARSHEPGAVFQLRPQQKRRSSL